MAENNIFEKEGGARAVLVSVVPKGADEREYEVSFDELARLADTAGAEVFARLTQQKENPDVRTYIGKGKVEELAKLCENNDIDVVIFDDELSPSQIKNLENDIGGDVRVIDRSMLILDIFALHAVSGEGKLVVFRGKFDTFQNGVRSLGRTSLRHGDRRIGKQDPVTNKFHSKLLVNTLFFYLIIVPLFNIVAK